jgi:DNA (cytosine-5)-methyltransferase 1
VINQLTFGSLFSGVGGIDLAFERAGFKVMYQCEIDKAARGVLAYHWPDVPRYEDVCDVNGRDLPAVDVIAFGSPCQDLSVAGARAGLEGQRSGLFFEAIRILAERKPTFALWENVPGAFSANSGRDFLAVLNAFRGIGARDIAWRTLDARYFGLAQRRRRVFLVADFRGERAAQILFESESGGWYPAPRRTTGEGLTPTSARGAYALGGGITHTLSSEGADASETGQGRGTPLVLANPLGAGQHGWRQDIDNDTYVAHSVRPSASRWLADGADNLVPDVARSQTARNERLDGESETFIAAFDPRNITSKANRTRVESGLPANTLHAEGLSVITQAPIAQSNRGEVTGEVGETVRSDCHGAIPMVAAFLHKQGSKAQGIGYEIENSPTLRSETGAPAPLVPAHGVRRLTPTECETLQGLPVGWTERGIDGAQSDSARYRQIGNGVAVPCLEWIARRIVEQEAAA